MNTLIAPSILSADFAKLGDEISKVERAGADVIHVDVMDGHFVPNITIGPPVVAKVRRTTKLPLDCHLMIENPEKYIEAFAKAGADWISVHVEACDLSNLLPAIKKLGAKAGCVINPPTPIEDILPCVAQADYVLVMTVNPGFSGQSMIEGCLDKIQVLRKHREEKGLDYLIEIDGGVKVGNIGRVMEAGPDVVVAGSAIFGTGDYAATIARLKNA